MVGLIPLFAVEVLDEEIFQLMPEFTARLDWFLQNRPDLANLFRVGATVAKINATCFLYCVAIA
jgi:hypothetical protein